MFLVRANEYCGQGCARWKGQFNQEKSLGHGPSDDYYFHKIHQPLFMDENLAMVNLPNQIKIKDY
jgi:hypothetical protein